MLSKITDLARIFGATAIFYYHIGLATKFRFSEWGEFAVASFIVISGIAYTCFSSSKPHDLPSYNHYVSGKLKVIFPMFITINVLIYFASFLHPSDLGRPFSLLELVLSSTGLSQYFGFRYMSHVMWFIPFILQAYLIFPGITALLDRFPAGGIVLAAFVLSLSAIALTYVHLPVTAQGICRNWCVIFRLPEVCMGIIIGQGVAERQNRSSSLIALTLFIALSLVLATIVVPYFEPAGYILSLPWRGTVVTLLIMVLSSAAAPAIGQTQALRLLRLLGTASFPFFLLHGIAILFVYHHVGNAVVPWILYFAFCWCEAIAVTLAFGFARRTMRRATVARTIPVS